MKTYSTHPAAVYARNRRLQRDDVNERTNASNKSSRKRKRLKRLAHKTTVREQLLTTNRTGRAAKVWLATVARHLSKGRDAVDIAVRERVRVSRVLEAIASIQSPGIKPEQQKAKP